MAKELYVTGVKRLFDDNEIIVSKADVKGWPQAAEVNSLANQARQAIEEKVGQLPGIEPIVNKLLKEITDVATTFAAAIEELDPAMSEIAENIRQTVTGTQDASTTFSSVSRNVTETDSNRCDTEEI